MAGLLDFVNRGMANPLTHLGMGLMASSQPRYSTNIADLNGGGIGSGLLTGMDSFQRYQQNQSDLDYKQGILGAKQKKLMADEEDEARRRQGLQALLATVKDPEKRMVLSGLLSSGADPASAFKTATADPAAEKMPPDAVLAGWLAPNATREEQIKAVSDYKARQAAAGANRTDVRVGGPQGFEPQTPIGKIAYDLEQAQKLPDGPIKESTIKALQQKLASSGLGAEQGRAEGKMRAAGEVADRFNELADQSPGDVGLVGGNITKSKMEGGLLGNAIRAASDQTGSEAELTSMAAQMKTQLGTALSGAAIPKEEWPNYMAQVPGLTDSKAARHAKAKTFKALIKTLEAIARGEMTKDALNAPLLPQENTPKPEAPSGKKRIKFDAQGNQVQ